LGAFLDKQILFENLKSYNECRLGYPLSIIDNKLFDSNYEKDPKTKEILEFTRNTIYWLSLEHP
jgi:hypothetical protein